MLKIERAELRLVPLRLRERFEISSGGRQDRMILLVTIHGGGMVGWGECVAAEDPSYSYETTETAWHILTELGDFSPVPVTADPADRKDRAHVGAAPVLGDDETFSA